MGCRARDAGPGLFWGRKEAAYLALAPRGPLARRGRAAAAGEVAGIGARYSALQREGVERLSLAFKAPRGGQEGNRGHRGRTYGSWCRVAVACWRRTPAPGARLQLCPGAPAPRARPLPTHSLAPPLQPAVTSAASLLLPRLCLQPRHFINYSVTGQATKVGFSPAIFGTLELLKPSSPRTVSIW